MQDHKLLIKTKTLLQSRRFQIIAGSTLALLLWLNLGVFAYYHGKTLPHTKLGNQAIGTVDFSQFPEQLNKRAPLPKELKLAYQTKKSDIRTSDFGLTLDAAKIKTYSQQHRSWLPLANLFGSHEVPVYIEVNNKQFDKGFAGLIDIYKQDAVNASIVHENGNFSLKFETDGYKLNQDRVRKAIVKALGENRNSLGVPVALVKPAVSKEQLQPTLDSLKQQQRTSVIFRYQSKNAKLSPQDIANLYVPSGTGYELSDSLIRAEIVAIGSSFGIRVQNISEAVSSTRESIKHAEDADFSLVAVTISRSYTYCVQLKGVDAGQQASFESKLQATLADNRGWSLGGQVSFTKVDSGCSMRVWLTAADQMSSFGAICDSMWSCTVSPNVIINFDRWSGASPAWNSAGGSLDDYRSMVINHEVGHWLGFGHKSCGGAGQAAPVMQQQSIDLQGCTFNPWPLPAETATLRSWYGI